MVKKNVIPRFLFTEGRGHGNAVLNILEAPESEFGLYAKAFHNAGQLLAEKFASSAGYSDVDACPIAFVYRHALELYLKSLVLTSTKLFEFSGLEPIETDIVLKQHWLTPMLPIIRRAFGVLGWEWTSTIDGLHNFDEVAILLEEMEDIDAGSYSFRYPMNKKGQASVSHHFIFDVPAFSSRMSALLQMLEAADMGFKAEYEKAAEWPSYSHE